MTSCGFKNARPFKFTLQPQKQVWEMIGTEIVVVGLKNESSAY